MTQHHIDERRTPFDPNAELVALRSMHLMGGGTLEELEQVVHPDFANHEAQQEPPACRGRGPGAAFATAVWLQQAYADLAWEIHEVVAERDIVVVHCTMSGRHAGDFVVYDEDGEVAEVFPPTGARFAVTQTHWLKVSDGKIIEHWANRDDIAQAKQLGWIPPSPRYLLRMARAKRRAKRRG